MLDLAMLISCATAQPSKHTRMGRTQREAKKEEQPDNSESFISICRYLQDIIGCQLLRLPFCTVQNTPAAAPRAA